MSELKIQEEKRGFVTILHLKGALSQLTLSSLDSLLTVLLTTPSPELVILEFSELSNFEQSVVPKLHNKAELFSNQARELAIVSTAKLDRSLFAPPLMQYPSIEKAIQTLEQSQLQEDQTATKQAIPTAPHILKLSILAGPCSGNAYLRPGDKELVIGRHSQCALSLPQDIKVSRFHCKLYEKNGCFVLEDLKSSNGTFFEEQMITQPVEVKHGDRFQLGETLVEVAVMSETTSGKPAAPVDFTLPSLAAVDEPASDDVPNLKYGAMETVIGVSLNDLWSEVLKTPPAASKSIPAETIKLSMVEAAKVSKLELPSEAVHPLVGRWDRRDLIDIQTALPTIIKQIPFQLPDPKIAGRYEFQEKTSESNAWAMLRCKDRGESVFVQITKTMMGISTLPACHPHLLLPACQGEFASKIYRVFIRPGIPIPADCKVLPEHKALQIGILLCDVLLALHEVGQSGFDLGRGCIFYQPNELPYFALMPAFIYENLSSEDADIFSLGLLMLDLITGQSIPYTAIGNLDQQKFVEQAQQVSPELLCILVEIFKRQDSDLENIMAKFKELLGKRLSPKIGAREPVMVQICSMGDNLVTDIDHVIVSKTAVSKSALAKGTEIPQNMPTLEALQAWGQKIYREFYPKRLLQFFDNSSPQNLVLVLDDILNAVPWEIAYDGKEFLGKQYCFSRRLLAETGGNRPGKIDSPRFMILAGNEPWQQQVKQELTQKISALFPSAKIKAFDVKDDPFEILQSIARCDIFHVVADIVFQQEDPLDSGWILEPHRILKLHFLENAPRVPKCIVVQHATPKFFASLYSLGVPHVVGSIWPLHNAAVYGTFYEYLMQGNTVELALAQTKKQLTNQIPQGLGIITYGHSKRSLITPHTL